MVLYSRDTARLLELQDAVKEAERFVLKAKAAHLALVTEQESFGHSTSFAAARRASMDLTKVLAHLRGRRG